MPRIAEQPKSTLSISVPGHGYISSNGLKIYLRELTKFDFFKYVLFVDENKTFKGYLHARNLLYQLFYGLRGEDIVDKINKGDIEKIPGFKRDYIKDNISNRQALRIMEKKGITEVAVVDEDMKFLGFTHQEMITTRIINNLMIKER